MVIRKEYMSIYSEKINPYQTNEDYYRKDR